MRDKSDDRKSSSEKIKPKSDKCSESKPEKELSEKDRTSSAAKPTGDKNGMLCPKSVRNQMKKIKENSDKEIKPEIKVSSTKSKQKEDEFSSKYLIKKSISHISTDKNTVEVVKINQDKIQMSTDNMKSTKCKPSLLYSCNPLVDESKLASDNATEQSPKHKKKKKHNKSKNHNDSDDGNKDGIKAKKSRKSKKKKHKEASSEEVVLKKEPREQSKELETVPLEKPAAKAPMSLLVSYSSDEEDGRAEPVLATVTNEKISPILSKPLAEPDDIKAESKIEIKIKPTKSPGKSAWDSSDSELDHEVKDEQIVKGKSRSASVVSKHSKRSKSSSSKDKSDSKSCSKSHSDRSSRSHSRSHSRSGSRSSKSHDSSDSRSRSYSRSHSRSYSDSSDSRSRSYSRSRSHSRRKSRRHRRHSSSYSRSHSRYRSRSASRSSSDSRSSRSYSRSRSRYKSSYSTRYRSRSRSSRSRSRNSYYRSSYRRRKRSSSPEDFLNPQNRKVKQMLNRNSLLLGAAPKPVDISKKIDAIKESQKKVADAHNNQNLSNLNIPLPPEKPKANAVKPGPGEWCPSMDFGGPVAKKAKKMPPGSKVDGKNTDVTEGAQSSDNQFADYSYIGPQVSSDMAKKLGLDVKSTAKKDKDNSTKKAGSADSMGESYLSQALDASHLALQSRAYQHRLNNLHGGNSNVELSAQAAQYFHPLYMSPSSLTNNLTATALAAVASEQLPASVAGSLAQAAVQRIMSSSNLTATYNTPAVVATPTASYQTALQHTIPASCSTLVANTPSGLVPISLLQQSGVPYGINQLVLQHLQQQALNAQLGQAIAIPSQSILGGINPLLLQASNQQALLQSLGFGAQTQLLTSPLNLQHTLLMAAQQQQHQMLAAAQLNQAATFQAAQLQAQIQAQARAASLQNLQQAAQMQSSAQSASAAAVAAAMSTSSSTLDQVTEQLSKAETDQIPMTIGDEVKLNIGEFQMVMDDVPPSMIENNLITSSTTELNHLDESTVNTTVTSEPPIETVFGIDIDNDLTASDVSSSNVMKQQAPRIIYNSPAVMASIVTSPVTKP